MSNVCCYKFLVIDNQDLLEINNLKRKVNQALKHPEPIFKMDAPCDTENDMFNCFNVLYDKKEKSFKMLYDITKHVKGQYNEGGWLEGDRLNARWCDSIKHRSGNWDRNSHEPAGGVPPYTEPEPNI